MTSFRSHDTSTCLLFVTGLLSSFFFDSYKKGLNETPSPHIYGSTLKEIHDINALYDARY